MNVIIKKIVVFIYKLRIRVIVNKKISGIQKSINDKIQLSKINILKHRELWGRLNSNPNLNWYRVFASVNGIDDPRYITEYDYYVHVEPCLNHKTFCEAYSDKNFYHRIIYGNLLPKVYYRLIDGVLYDQDYKRISADGHFGERIANDEKKIIIKKSFDTGGGRGVSLAKRIGSEWVENHGKKIDWDYLRKVFNHNFVVQEYIEQHPFFSRFNESSVNTIRLFTYRSVKNNEVIPLQSVLRIGQSGSIVDNQASGGISCGINKDGFLNSFAVSKYGEKILSHNGVLFSQEGLIYKFHEIISTAKQIASDYYYHRLIGFDFCVDKNSDIKLIEINTKNNEINFFQMNNGPLFGEYTNEVIDFCAGNRKTWCFDFDL